MSSSPKSTALTNMSLDMEAVINTAKAFFDSARASHDWDHTRRVAALCERIARAEGADLDVVLVAAYLHDIGRDAQDAENGRICHAREGKKKARPVVEGLALTREQKDNILHCIRAHRFRGNNRPETLEARVLFDADKLDAIGAVGIARTFQFAGEVGAVLHNPDKDVTQSPAYSKDDTGYREYKVKLSKIKDRMFTGEGLQLAKERHAFMEDFFKRFLDEYKAKK